MKNLSLILLTAFLTTACVNTFRGIGEDMQAMGKAISGASGSGSSQNPPARQPANDVNSNSTRY